MIENLEKKKRNHSLISRIIFTRIIRTEKRINKFELSNAMNFIPFKEVASKINKLRHSERQNRKKEKKTKNFPRELINGKEI